MAKAQASAVSLQRHIEDMRNLMNCKICLRPFYEPFILGCGHTYCYGCLKSWFDGQTDQRRSKSRNCPDCRTVVTSQPAPNYLLRDLAHMFTDRAELLPEEETVAEHVKGRAEEATLLVKDRAESKLFGGFFERNAPPNRNAPIRDVADDVWRCPTCTFEVEDGACNHCGWTMDDYSDDEDSFSDEDDEDEDDVSVESLEPSLGPPMNIPYYSGTFWGVDPDHVDDGGLLASSDSDQYDPLDTFIDDGEVDESNEDDYPDEVDNDGISVASGATYDRAVSVSSSSDEDVSPNPYTRTRIPRHITRIRADSESTPSEVERACMEADARINNYMRTTRRRPIVIASDDDSDEALAEPDEQVAAFSDPESSEEEDESPRVSRHRSRRQAAGSETEESMSASESRETEQSGSGDSESDRTATPQSYSSRRGHLVQQRARRRLMKHIGRPMTLARVLDTRPRGAR